MLLGMAHVETGLQAANFQGKICCQLHKVSQQAEGKV